MTYLKYAPRRQAQERAHRSSAEWTPPVDIVEREDVYTLEFDLPGFERDDLDVSVKDGVLTVTGERKFSRPADEETKYFRFYERAGGTFTRSFNLPKQVDAENIAAQYKNGVLSLTLAKREEAKPYSVTIK